MKTINPSANGMPSLIAWLITRPILVNAARVALISPFLISGIVKLFDFHGAVAEVTALKLQPAAFIAGAVVLTQLGGSALFMTRRFAWLGAGMLSVFTLIAMLLAHPFWNFPDAERGHQIATFFEHVAIIGGFAAAAILIDRGKAV